MLDEGLMVFEDKAGPEGLSLDAPEDQERMNEMFRAAHSLKGLGAAMGFDKIRDLTHLMETLFDHVRMGQRSLDSVTIETLFGVFDKLKELVKELSDTPDQPVTIEDALSKLESILSTPMKSASGNDEPCDDAVDQPETVVDETPSASGDSAGESTPVNVNPSSGGTGMSADSAVLDNPELARLFVETTMETLDDLNEGLLKLEENPEDLDTINEVFRCAHNIKGATGAAGCESLYHLTHDMETALDLVRSGKLKLDDALMQAVFKVADRVRDDVDLIREGKAETLTAEGTVGMFDEWVGSSDSSPEGVQEQPPASEATGVSSEIEVSSNDGEWVVRVTFPKDYVESEIQAYLINNKLQDIGTVLETIPDIDAMDGSSTLTEIVYRLQCTAPADEVKKILETYPVESVEVSTSADFVPGDQASTDSSAPAPAPEISTTETEEVEPPKTTTAPKVESTPKAPAPPKAAPVEVQSSGTTELTPPAKSKTPPPKSKSAPVAAASNKMPAKVGETIRVDLERLDQLMNLGGELVINKARMAQIHSRFNPLFQGQNVNYLVDDISNRVEHLGEGIKGLSASGNDQKRIGELSDSIMHLSHDFEIVKGLVNRVHAGRGVMNDFSEALHSLNTVSEGIQKRIMETRMVSVGPLFQRFRRVVRDISRATGKNVELVLHGETTEMDKRMIDELGDPLTHMIRNSVDHGIESPEDRVQAGKPETAQVTLEAYHRGRHICIEVRDDGRGINVEAVRAKIIERELATEAEVERMSEKEIIQYVLKPGFSTAQVVTDLSGRGMGMDIVVNKLDSINGTVELDSVVGEGATVTIKLPLTLAIITALISRIGKFVYAIPLDSVAEIITVPQSSFQYIQKRRVVRVRERVIPVALFEQVFNTEADDLKTAARDDPNVTLVIVESQDETIGLAVDEMIGQEDVVIKSLADNFRNVDGIAGASIMGDGAVALILDVASMMGMFTTRGGSEPTPSEHDAIDSEERHPLRKEVVNVVAG